MRVSIQVLGMMALLHAWVTTAVAQEAAEDAGLCRETACAVVVDWQGGVPNVIDRRYGNPYRFEARLRTELEGVGLRLLPAGSAPGDAVHIVARPSMARAMCDRTPGTNTDMSCQTVGEVRVEVLNADPELDIRRSMRIRGRCGADEMMDVARMSEHVAASIDYELRGREGRRPSTKC